jgi:hypothetical protein
MPRLHNDEGVLARRQQVGAMYLAGKYQADIARLVGVTQQQISHDLAALRKLWLASSVRDFNTAKAEELAKVDRVEHEYWVGWERSLQDHVQNLAEIKTGDKPGRKRSRRREGQAGDPRFLDGVLKCVERRCTILGLDAPKHFKIDWDSLNDDQLVRLARGEAPEKVLAAPVMAEA